MEMRKASPKWSYALLTGALAFVAFSAVGQKPEELDRIIEFSTPFDQAQSKFIHEGVTDQDPGALVWIDPVVQSVLLRLHVELDPVQLQAVVGQAGLHITYLGPPRHEVGAMKALVPNSTDAAPVYVNTGDPAKDNARYELEKKTWIAVHPDLYQQQAIEPE
jgi:hypothetical protein